MKKLSSQYVYFLTRPTGHGIIVTQRTVQGVQGMEETVFGVS